MYSENSCAKLHPETPPPPLIFAGNPHSPFSLGPETPPPAYSPHADDGGDSGRPPNGGGGGGTSMDTDTTQSEPVPYQVGGQFGQVHRQIWLF